MSRSPIPAPTLDLREDVQRELVLATRRYWAGPLYRRVVAGARRVGQISGPDQLERALARMPAYQAFGWLEHHLQIFKYTGPGGLMPAAERQRQVIEAMLAASDMRHPERLVLDPAMPLPGYYRDTDFHLVPGGIHSRSWDGVVYEWAAGTATMMQNESADVHDSLAGYLATVTPGRQILDLGCGFGPTVRALARVRPDATVTGCDLSAPVLRLAHHRALAEALTVRFVQANGENLAPFPDQSVDLVTATMLIHELPPPALRAVLRAAQRVLRPGGRLVVLDFYLIPGGTLGRFFHLGHARRNREPFMPALLELDLPAELRAAGFSAPQISPYPAGQSLDQVPESWRLPWTLIEAEAPGGADAA